MRSVSKRQKLKDPNAVCSVSSFTPRPMLRVGGGKNEGTRFLTFVDAMIGFKHLLTQEDLDKAASMCQGLKGHLKSRFLVLSDDRLPPPPPSKKRPFSNVDGEENPNVKRFGNPSSFGPGQVPAQIQGQFQYHVPHGSSQAMMSVTGPEQVTAQIHGPPQFQLQSLPSQTQAHSLTNGVQQVQQVLQYPSQQMLSSGQPLFSPSSFPPLPGVHQIPVAQDLSTVPMVQPGKIVVGGGGYQTVQGRNSRRRSNAPDKGKSKKALDKARGMTEELDPDFQEGESDASFADASEI